jgi:hypothetical protein
MKTASEFLECARDLPHRYVLCCSVFLVFVVLGKMPYVAMGEENQCHEDVKTNNHNAYHFQYLHFQTFFSVFLTIFPSLKQWIAARTQSLNAKVKDDTKKLTQLKTNYYGDKNLINAIAAIELAPASQKIKSVFITTNTVV